MPQPPPDPVRVARSMLGVGVRVGLPPEAIAELRRSLTEAKAERAILEALRAEPAISTDQMLYLANLLVVAADLTPDQRNAVASMVATNGTLR